MSPAGATEGVMGGEVMGILMFLSVLALGGAAVAIVLAIMSLSSSKEKRDRQAETDDRLRRLEGLSGRIMRLEEEVREGRRPPPAAEAPTEEPVRPESPAPEVPRVKPVPEAPPERETPKEIPIARPVGVEEGPKPVPAEPARAMPPEPASDAGPEEPPIWGRVEEMVGKRWMTWVGVLALFLAVVFFVKYAIDEGWLTPWTRVVMGLAFGMALLVVGDVCVRRKMTALGQGLMGGGLGMLYVSLFAAYSFYGLISDRAAFGTMALVTVGGLMVALAHDAPAVSLLATLGGFLTPVMVWPQQDIRDALMTYVMLLDLAVLGAAVFKRWRALDVLAFVGTVAIFASWYVGFYESPAMAPTLMWLGAFFLVFLLLPFVYHFRRATPIALERFVTALLNASWMFGYSHWILHKEHAKVLGYIALGMAACYVAMGRLLRRRMPADARGLFGFVTLAVLFLTIGIGQVFEMDGVTLCWAASGPALLYLGLRYKYLPVRVYAFALLALAAIRVFWVHWPLHEGAYTLFFTREFGTVICVPAAWALYALILERFHADGGTLDRSLKEVSAIAAGFLALVLMHSEVGRWIGAQPWEHGTLWVRCFGIALWTAGAVAFMAAGTRWPGSRAKPAGMAALVVSLVLAFRLYGEGWGNPAFEPYGITLCWALEGLVLLGIGYGFAVPALRAMGLAAVALTAVRIFGAQWPMHQGSYRPILNAAFGTAMCVPLAGVVYALIHRACRRWGSEADEVLKNLGGILAAYVALVLVHSEIGRWIGRGNWGYQGTTYYVRCYGAGLWAAGTACFIWAGVRWRSAWPWASGLGALGTSVVLGFFVYGMDLAVPGLVFINLRFITALVAVGMVLAYSHVLLRRGPGVPGPWRGMGLALRWIEIVLIPVLLSLEVYLYCRGTFTDIERARWASQMAVSIVWGAYAAALLFIGFLVRVRSLRLSGLALFGLTALKLVLVDIAKVKDLYRIVAFLVLGALMVWASYLYHKIEKRMEEGMRTPE